MSHRPFVYPPINHACQGLRLHSLPGFAAGRQRAPRPVRRTLLLQRAPQATIRYADEVSVVGLPLAAVHLAGSQHPLLLAVPPEGLSPCPAMSIVSLHPYHCPLQPVRAQRFTRLPGGSLPPQGPDPHRRRHVGKRPLFAEVPLPRLPHPHGFFRLPGHLPGTLLALLRRPLTGLFASTLSPVRYSAPWCRAGSVSNTSPKTANASCPRVGKSPIVGITAAFSQECEPSACQGLPHTILVSAHFAKL